MKKLIIILAIGGLFQFNSTCQSEDFALLCSITENIDEGASSNYCTPWASSLRLINIKTNNQVEKDLIRYEGLWLALQKTCLKDQRVSTRVMVQLDKRGRIKNLESNGQQISLDTFPQLKRKRFKELRSDSEKQVKIYTKIG